MYSILTMLYFLSNGCSMNKIKINTCIAKTGIASLYFQCYNLIAYSEHTRGSEKYRFVKMCGGARRPWHAYFLLNRLFT